MNKRFLTQLAICLFFALDGTSWGQGSESQKTELNESPPPPEPRPDRPLPGARGRRAPEDMRRGPSFDREAFIQRFDTDGDGKLSKEERGAARESMRRRFGEREGRGRRRLNQRFEENSPGLGEALPDVRAYDASGKEFSLASLKGRHSVIVFGCLT